MTQTEARPKVFKEIEEQAQREETRMQEDLQEASKLRMEALDKALTALIEKYPVTMARYSDDLQSDIEREHIKLYWQSAYGWYEYTVYNNEANLQGNLENCPAMDRIELCMASPECAPLVLADLQNGIPGLDRDKTANLGKCLADIMQDKNPFN